MEETSRARTKWQGKTDVGSGVAAAEHGFSVQC